MGENWLEIPDESIDAQELMSQIERRISAHNEEAEDLVAVVQAVRQEVIGMPLFDATLGSERIALWQNDCDIVPHDYVIDWRVPILGPINALVRRVINAEIQRYLLACLRKQTHLNRQILYVLQQLADENERLKRQIEELTHASPSI